MHSLKVGLLLAVGWLCATLSAAQAPAPSVTVDWQPERPVGGSLVLVRVQPAAPESVVAVRGALAGEPLHFERDSAGAFRGLGGVPVDSADTVELLVEVQRLGDMPLDEARAAMPVGPRTVTQERLRTASRFVDPPDSELAQRIRAEREQVQDVLRATHDTPRLWKEAFLRPRPGRITSRFATERVFNGVVESRHLGVDLAGKTGSVVRAANRGVVSLVADLFYSGTTVLLDHGAGLVTGYLHLSRALVQPGDTVARGQVIGRVGATGRVTSAHLHWFAHYGRVAVDPLQLLALKPL